MALKGRSYQEQPKQYPNAEPAAPPPANPVRETQKSWKRQGKNGFEPLFNMFTSKSKKSYTKFLKQEDIESLREFLKIAQEGILVGVSETKNPTLVEFWYKLPGNEDGR